MREIKSNRCLHCNYPIYEFNESRFLEVVSDFKTMEKRYCCFSCFEKYYDLRDRGDDENK